ncbi:MAG: hypothetical protein RAP41_08455 [Candidatus Orphnella occulta]|nr:hypothetical protein [Candidatus Orphnella occulta]
MEKLNKISKDISAKHVLKPSSGEGLMLSGLKNGAGLGCGLKKAIAYVNYVNYQAIANLSFSKSKITGLIHYLMKSQIIPATNT